jgi:hypothetical protein
MASISECLVERSESIFRAPFIHDAQDQQILSENTAYARYCADPRAQQTGWALFLAVLGLSVLASTYITGSEREMQNDDSGAAVTKQRENSDTCLTLRVVEWKPTTVGADRGHRLQLRPGDCAASTYDLEEDRPRSQVLEFHLTLISPAPRAWTRLCLP